MLNKQDLYRAPKGFKESTFEGIKELIIKYAKSTTDIKDFDYSGSTANSFVSVQAYSLLKQELLANIAIMENNIHTARDRRSVVQLAQNNGYVPSGVMSSKITVGLQCTTRNNDPSIKIPRGTKFQGQQRGEGRSYRFVVMEDVNAIRGAGGLYFPIVKLAQGRIMRIEQEYNSEIPIIIRDRRIDRDQIKVWVDGALWANWTYNNIVDVTGGSTVYYVRETYDGDTQINFGVGEVTFSKAGGFQETNYIGGLKPMEGAKIVIEYLRTEGYEANGCRHITYNDTLPGVVVEDILVNYNNDPNFIGSFGGGDIEDIESIRENGILSLESQRRAVTDTDWKTILDRRYSPIIQAREIFHPTGMPNIVSVAIKPKGALNLSTDQIREIREYLNQYHMGKITAEVIRPNYVFVNHHITVNYSANELMESKDWLENKVIDNLSTFYKSQVEFFNTPLHKSKLLTAVDETHPAIKGSYATFKLLREIESFYQTSYLGIKFYNRTIPGTFKSNVFTFIRNPDRDPSQLELVNDIFIQSAPRKDNKSVIIAGPFLEGDIDKKYPEYKGVDIERRDIKTLDGLKPDRYYEIGTVDHDEDYYEWSFGKIGLDVDNFNDPYIEVFVDPNNENTIEVGTGALLIFEHDLRPQYTTFTWDVVT